ncbi:hypothetical protein QMK19_11450 [Streptomyces sp. H10-C2]|uniref:hypothetical protein n=1 Tax=unclassified Streptomyces TaxID=2593676 RepID=UPI0024BAFDA5|nr:MULTISPECIES: hypothetical protein [unclassified Streptomyces]MDJ0340626.1 hypothetical protein [Streptomyces sp. PH10-H1]MDJ0370274.1 hypothetical protein [Streptomyces sp. H10-C2]
MTDGPTPPHDPRQGFTAPTPPEGGDQREVLEGRVIPSRPLPYQAQPRPEGAPPAPGAPQPPQIPQGAAQQPPNQPDPYGSAAPAWPPAGAQPTAPPQQPQQPAQGGPSGPQAPAWAPPTSGLGAGGTPQSSFPQQPQGPAAGPSPFPQAAQTNAPDWGALAEQREAAAKRRKLFMVGGGALAAVAVAGIVATAVVMSNQSDGKPKAGPTTTASQQPLPPEPSFSSVAPPPPKNPLDYISTAKKDSAPISADTLFPGKLMTIAGRTYTKAAGTSTTTCAAAATDGLAAALPKNNCRQLIRATYIKDGSAVTVGVALFDDKPSAEKLKLTSRFLLPLNGAGVGDFCHNVACWATSNTVGRYAYFTISGPKDGQSATAADTASKQAGADASNFAFERIVQRGKDAAAAETAAGN